MKNLLFACLMLLCIGTFGQSASNSNYSTLWDLIGRQEFNKAQDLISSGKIEREKMHDTYITELYLKEYLHSEDEVTDFIQSFYSTAANPDPYVYAMWFSPPVLGEYGRKTKPHQVAMIKALLRNPKTSGTLRAGAQYNLGMHYLFQNKFDSAHMQFEKTGGIQNWQYVGPFENLSQSGIYKNYGPLGKPDSKAEFTSLTNAKIKWFTPPHENPDGWVPLSFHIKANTGVGYTQTFVTSPTDQEVIINVGATGAIRVWLNDFMVLSEPTERLTEFDAYSVKCKLQKGVNRILVQLSFTNSSYPNFGLRLTDVNFNPIPGLAGSAIFKPYNKYSQSPVTVKHFAEEFFQKKIQAEPGNVVNYLLLSDVYMRNRKTIEARNLVESAIKISPNNLLRSKLIDILVKEENNTVMLEEVDKIRKTDSQAPLILEIDITNNTNTERYADGLDLVAQYEKLYGEDLKTQQLKMAILSKQSKIPELVDLAERMFKQYPDEPKLIQLMYVIRKEINRDKEAAMLVYENFLKRNYDYKVYSEYIKLLHQEGKTEEVTKRRQWLVENFPYETFLLADMAQYHFAAKEYTQAQECLEKALALSPYDENLWERFGDVKREQGKKDEAIQAFQRSLQFHPNQYDVIGKLRTLVGKPDVYKIIPAVNVDETITRDVAPESSITSDKGYYIILEDRAIVMHPGGATEDYNTYVFRITNEKGIEAYKESTINYSSNQNLFIEQYDLIKKTGARIRGERKNNEIVFTNLEVGDVVVYRYRYQNFYTGRFANDFWAKHFFQSECYVARSRYSILLPATRKLNYVTTNSSLQPSIKSVEDFKQYSWEVLNQPAFKDESYMPAVVDIAPVLHMSTLNSWNEVASWYADLINKSSEETYELTSAFQNIFSAKDLKKMTEFEKAKTIYSYIEKNIRYSSVSFRQGAYLPQSASKTLSTRLGDCKDLSNLFMKLCEMAGVRAQMVLTDTRDNGEKDMVLPSIDFNHCIAKVNLDGKEFFIELTDHHLPFTSLPNSLIGALILEIPRNSGEKNVELKKLDPNTKPNDIAKADLIIRPEGNDLLVDVRRIKHGHLTTQLRSDFSSLPYDKQLLKLHDYVSSQSKNITIDTLAFRNLESTDDSVLFTYRYKIQDEIAEVASMKTFKLVFPDVVATSNHFSSTTRDYPVNYVAYEDTDYYETKIRVEIPHGKKFLDVPPNVSLTFGGMTYDLQYTLVQPDVLEVSRKFKSNRNVVDVKQYAELKSFLDRIVKSEQRMIVF